MKRPLCLLAALLPLLSAVLLAVACQSAPRPGADGELSADEALACLEKIAGGIENLAREAAEKGWIDTTRTASDATVDRDGADTPVPPQPDLWFDHDFSILVDVPFYALVSTAPVHLPEGDATYLVTRLGDKVWFVTFRQGILVEGSLSAFNEEGRTVTYYHGGKKGSTATYNERIHGHLADLFAKKGAKVPVYSDAGSCDLSHAEVVTFLGRPAWIVRSSKDTTLATGTLHMDVTSYVDKEYGIIFKRDARSTSIDGLPIDLHSWTVKAFTDHPTQHDIPNLTADPKAALIEQIRKTSGSK